MTASTNVKRLRSTMQQFIDSGEIPGLIYHVETADTKVTEALGNRDLAGHPMERDTIVRISSMTKPVAAVATLILVEVGRFQLDQPIIDVIPELRDVRVLQDLASNLDDTIPAKRPITVEDLLTFRMGSGIVLAMPGTYPIQRAMDERQLGIGPPDPATPPEPDEWMRRFSELPLVRQPGEEWMYVTSSEVLGVFLSRVSSTPLPDLLQDLVFDPLGMPDTSFFVPESKSHRFATQYIRDEERDSLVARDTASGGQWNQMPDFPSAGGGLVSTVDDYARFARMLLHGGIHEGGRLLSNESVKAMVRNHLTPRQREPGELILGPGKGWGYCVSVKVEHTEEPGEIGSYGWNGGLGTTWLNDPSVGLIAILLTQVQWTAASYPESALEFLREAYRTLYQN